MVTPRKLLVLDTSYAWQAIRARGLEHSVTCRDLDGFFEHVWTVHPFASLVEQRVDKIGRPEVHTPAPAHTFINGKIGRFEALRAFPKLNFLLGQTEAFAKLVSLIRREKISAIRAGDLPAADRLVVAIGGVSDLPSGATAPYAEALRDASRWEDALAAARADGPIRGWDLSWRISQLGTQSQASVRLLLGQARTGRRHRLGQPGRPVTADLLTEGTG